MALHALVIGLLLGDKACNLPSSWSRRSVETEGVPLSAKSGSAGRFLCFIRRRDPAHCTIGNISSSSHTTVIIKGSKR